MKKTNVFLIFLFLFLFRIGNSQIEKNIYFSNKDAEVISKKVEQLMDKYKTPGVSIALVNENGIIWNKGFGVVKENSSHKITAKTLFSIESQTKMFTTLGVLSADEQNFLNIDVPIKNYLPELKVHSVFEKDSINKITLKNLLSHTAGFPHDAPAGNNYNSNVSFNTHIKSILSGLWLQFPIGKGYNYSNVGIDLAGYILQVVTKETYQEFIDKNVLKPLGMYDSTFSVKKYLSSSDHAVGSVDGLKNIPINHSIIPAGGLYSNVDDMSHYIQFQINNGFYNGHTILSKKSLKTMLTIPFPFKGQKQGNALGIWKGKRLNTTYFSHLGRGFGFADNLEWYPEYKIGIVVLTNKYDTSNVDIKISHMIIDPIIKKKFVEKKRDLEKEILGEYISNNSTVIKVIKDTKTDEISLEGAITFGPTENFIHKGTFPLIYLGQKIFYSTKENEKYRFIEKGFTGVPILQRIVDGNMWFMNDMNNKKTWNSSKRWTKYIGVYDLYGYTSKPMTFKIHNVKGNLYLDNYRLIQKNHNIFIMPNGQVIEFSKNNLIWAGIKLQKQES